MQDILLFLISSLALTLMPGPDILFVINQSLDKKKNGIITSLGLCTGLIFHTMFLAFGLSALINSNKDLMTFLKYFGTMYLFYLAYLEIKSVNKINKSLNSKLFLRGLYMNLINPKVLIFFIAYFPNFLFSDTIKISNQFLILGFVFILQALVVFIFVSVLANKLIKYLSIDSKNKMLKYFKSFILIIIALLILI
ncbi:MAG: LysE family translocator [Bacteroidetes bacterium]|nr:LysE family translocator [Bacteroidota bacterium]MDA1226092.1 LysE family translocator [Bacteroidota bacterium]